jgi:hypothetical protein
VLVVTDVVNIMAAYPPVAVHSGGRKNSVFTSKRAHSIRKTSRLKQFGVNDLSLSYASYKTQNYVAYQNTVCVNVTAGGTHGYHWSNYFKLYYNKTVSHTEFLIIVTNIYCDMSRLEFAIIRS